MRIVSCYFHEVYAMSRNLTPQFVNWKGHLLSVVVEKTALERALT